MVLLTTTLGRIALDYHIWQCFHILHILPSSIPLTSTTLEGLLWELLKRRQWKQPQHFDIIKYMSLRATNREYWVQYCQSTADSKLPLSMIDEILTLGERIPATRAFYLHQVRLLTIFPTHDDDYTTVRLLSTINFLMLYIPFDTMLTSPNNRSCLRSSVARVNFKW